MKRRLLSSLAWLSGAAPAIFIFPIMSFFSLVVGFCFAHFSVFLDQQDISAVGECFLDKRLRSVRCTTACLTE